MIKVTINDRDIELKEPITILKAAEEVGIKIPTLCYFEGLEPFGGCRLCLVEIEGLPRLQTACTIKVADGMKIKSDTEEIIKARRAMLEFLLINHPLDCPYCDKAGECDLQDLVAQYGPDAGRFREGKRRHPENLDDPIIVRNMERCILCTRCVRMCGDLQGAHAIAVTGRGGNSFIEPFSGGRYNCEYCGNCLTVCPVGAIMSRLHRYSYRPWFVEKEIETVCGFCGVGCTMLLQLKENSIIRAVPRVGMGLNKGLLCVRGRFGYDFIENRQRLTTPLMKKDTDLTPVNWDEAFNFIASRLREIKERQGSKAIGAIASGRCTNEDNYMLQKLIRFILGSNNIDSLARSYYAPAEAYLESIFGQGITANLIPGIANSDGVFVVGGDPTAINPILGLQIRASWRNDGKVIVLGPSGGLKRYINYELVPSPYAEEIVLLAILGRLIKSCGLRGKNKEIEEKLKGIKLPSDDEVRKAGVAIEDIEKASQDLARLDTPAVVIGPEIIERSRASKNLFILGAIAYLINARIFLLSEVPNYQGLMDMGCMPDMLPGARPIELEMFRHKVEDVVGLKVPEEIGLSLFEMIDAAEKGNLRALYVMGENPLFNIPDRDKVEMAFKNLDLLIVQDIYLTETARVADVVLPAAAWSEKEGTFTNLERRIQSVRKGITPASSREDWRIIEEIAKRLGMDNSYQGVEDVWEEITHVSPLHTGLSYEDISAGEAEWPYRGEPLRGVEGDFEIEGNGDLPTIPDVDKLYLFQERPLFHSATLSRRSKALLSIYPEPYLQIHPSRAMYLGLSDGEKAKVKTDKGTLELKIRLNSDCPKNLIFLSNIFERAGFNGMVGYSVDRAIGCLCIENNIVDIEKT